MNKRRFQHVLSIQSDAEGAGIVAHSGEASSHPAAKCDPQSNESNIKYQYFSILRIFISLYRHFVKNYCGIRPKCVI